MDPRNPVAAVVPGGCESPAVTLFGSFARGDDDGLSDIDVLVVKPPRADSDAWAKAMQKWASGIGRFCGSEVNVLEIDHMEWKVKRTQRTGVFAEIRRDGIELPVAKVEVG